EGLPVDISSRLTAFHALRKKVHLTTAAATASTICLSLVRVLRVRWCACGGVRVRNCEQLMKMALAMLSTGLSALRIIFAPKLLVKRLLLVASLQVFAAIIAKLYRILHFIYYELGARPSARVLRVR